MQLSTIAIVFVAALHIGFFVLESVLWTSPNVMLIFGNTEEEAQATRVLALNQGFYNLGAAALLMWFHTTDNTAHASDHGARTAPCRMSTCLCSAECCAVCSAVLLLEYRDYKQLYNVVQLQTTVDFVLVFAYLG